MQDHGDSPHDEKPVEMIGVLGSDFELIAREYRSISNRDGDTGGHVARKAFLARQLIRNLFALVEGMTFYLKVEALGKCLEGKTKTAWETPEGSIAMEEHYTLSDSGKLVTRPARLPLKANVRWAFSFFSRVMNVENPLDVQSEWWKHFANLVPVRDRLMHPRAPSDLDMRPDQVNAALEAEAGFKSALFEITGFVQR